MYTAHFGLNAAPFSITPDPNFLYLSNLHREALAHLLYGVNEGPGFVLLTGEVGTGKTTLCHCLINQLPDAVDVALLLNPRLSAIELLAALFDELRISYDKEQFTPKDYFDTLNTYLLTAETVGRRTVLILDEAQNLSAEVLEQVRLLTNLETPTHKLLQIILIGQPELQTLLKRNNLRQLAQRITARYHLQPLPLKDTQAYIRHRLAVSGAAQPLFTAKAMRRVHRYSGGIPRLINIICDRALLGGYVKSKTLVDTKIVRQAVAEVRGEPIRQRSPWRWAFATVSLVLMLIFLAALLWEFKNTPPETIQMLSESPPETINLPLPQQQTTPPEVPSLPVAEVAQPPPTLLELLQDDTVPSDAEAAFTTLFRYWELDYQALPGQTACERAAVEGFGCLSHAGNWEDIRQLNRPVVIELVTENGTQHHVVVTRLNEKVAVLDFAGSVFDFPLAKINEYWLGQFLLLWNPPALPVPMLKVGMVHEAVIWIKTLLDKIEGRQTPATPVFNQELRQRIIAFQRLHGLGIDGVVGEQTMLAKQA
ncbi:MAG: AAA family ATPase, partial [Pseudomonadota bacterium]|nr:AAA family ATPase [Pseudomonadota bacterium]